MTELAVPPGIVPTRPARIEQRMRVLGAGEVRADTPDGRRWLLRALPYERLDTYGTDFARGVFSGRLREDPPVLTFGHVYTDIGQIFGRMVDFTDGPEALDELFELDDFDAVPAARQVSAQLRSGTLRRFSVGFERYEDIPHPDPDARARGAKRITKGYQLELAIVLDPSVPGTGNLGMRSATGGGGPGLDDFTAGGHTLDDGGECVACAQQRAKDPSKPYGDVVYADPGYQQDKKKRYPIDTKAHVAAAISYLSQKANAAKYTAEQLKRMWSKLRAAASRFGIEMADDTGRSRTGGGDGGRVAVRAADGARVSLALVREVAGYIDQGLIEVDLGRQFLTEGAIPADLGNGDGGAGDGGAAGDGAAAAGDAADGGTPPSVAAQPVAEDPAVGGGAEVGGEAGQGAGSAPDQLPSPDPAAEAGGPPAVGSPSPETPPPDSQPATGAGAGGDGGAGGAGAASAGGELSAEVAAEVDAALTLTEGA